VSGWISAGLNNPHLFEIQFPLNLARSLVAERACVVEPLHALALHQINCPFQIAAPLHHIVGGAVAPNGPRSVAANLHGGQPDRPRTVIEL
jgi:hypothetical protein